MLSPFHLEFAFISLPNRNMFNQKNKSLAKRNKCSTVIKEEEINATFTILV